MIDRSGLQPGFSGICLYKRTPDPGYSACMNHVLPLGPRLAGQNSDRIIPEAIRAGESFARLYATVARLRAPDGCPWDREQTPSSIRGNVIEEAYELVEAIDEDDIPHIKEETGDLYLLGTMVGYLHEESGAFGIAEALDTVSEKLVRRHPHVFGDSEVDTAEGVVAQWNEIKETIEGRRRKDSILDEVSRALPPLERAYKVQKKAAKAGFDWAERNQVWEKFAEEIAETRQAAESASQEELEDEIGDLLFTVVNLSRHMGVDPALAMHGAVEKFCRRFHHVEKGMRAADRAMGPDTMREMDALWNQAKSLGL